jgi:[ribosomal protein S18]-alanine N-acetyltransferase
VRPAARAELATTRVESAEVGEGLLDSIKALAAEAFVDRGFSVEEELRRPWSRVWVAREARLETRGFLVAWHVADELHVLNVAVSPPFRERGIATELMQTALAYAAEQGIRIVLLEVRRSNRPALRLYRKLDFSAMGVRPGYYGDNGEDAIEMVLAFDPETGRRLPRRDEIRIDV